MLMSTEIKRCVTWTIYILDLLYVRYNCAKFHNCRIWVADFREGGLFAPPLHLCAALKSQCWIGLKVTIEKKWPTQNFDFITLKSLYSGHLFWGGGGDEGGDGGGLQLMQVSLNFKKSCCNLKVRGLGAKLCVVFPLF